MDRTQFTFYESWYKSVSLLKKKSEQAETMDAICKYALYAEEPEISGSPAAIFESIRPALDTARRKSENGKLGGSKKKAKENKEETSTSTSTRNSNRTRTNVNGYLSSLPSVEKKEGGQPAAAKFVPPSVEEVEAYIREKNYHVDAESFVASYESKGWKVGSSPMKNWTAALVTWEKRARPETVKSSPSGTDYGDLDALYDELVGGSA